MKHGGHRLNKESVTLADQPGVALCGDRAGKGGATSHEYEQVVGCPPAPQACALGVLLSSSEPQRPHLKNGESALGLKSGTGGGRPP